MKLDNAEGLAVISTFSIYNLVNNSLFLFCIPKVCPGTSNCLDCLQSKASGCDTCRTGYYKTGTVAGCAGEFVCGSVHMIQIMQIPGDGLFFFFFFFQILMGF